MLFQCGLLLVEIALAGLCMVKAILSARVHRKISWSFGDMVDV